MVALSNCLRIFHPIKEFQKRLDGVKTVCSNQSRNSFTVPQIDDVSGNLKLDIGQWLLRRPAKYATPRTIIFVGLGLLYEPLYSDSYHQISLSFITSKSKNEANE